LSKQTDAASLLTALGLPAAEGSIYELALTHRSFAHEQPEPLPHNERLEFLGDAVLGFIVTDLIYASRPGMAEGELSRLRKSLVEGKALAALARDVGLGPHLRLGKGEEASGGRDKTSLLENTLEALIGATYLDQGLPYLKSVLAPVLTGLVDESLARGSGIDPKSVLQEDLARGGRGRPRYDVAFEGPDHDRTFHAHVHIDEELYGVGSGTSKQAAEQAAAQEALDRLGPEAEEEMGSNARAS
jgi:ribonuclease III